MTKTVDYQFHSFLCIKLDKYLDYIHVLCYSLTLVLKLKLTLSSSVIIMCEVRNAATFVHCQYCRFLKMSAFQLMGCESSV